MLSKIKRFVIAEGGLETVEWAVIGVTVVIAAIVTFRNLGLGSSQTPSTISNAIGAGGN
jgi:Flp pilus assembly pilin Flp